MIQKWGIKKLFQARKLEIFQESWLKCDNDNKNDTGFIKEFVLLVQWIWLYPDIDSTRETGHGIT